MGVEGGRNDPGVAPSGTPVSDQYVEELWISMTGYSPVADNPYDVGHPEGVSAGEPGRGCPRGSGALAT